MFDTARILEPLDEERERLALLDGYRDTDELATALESAAAAVERSFRLLLRQDTSAPDDLRMVALSAERLPYDRLIPALTRSNRISLALAGRAHELRRTADRARSTPPRPADADLARGVIDRLRQEIASLEAETAGGYAEEPAEVEAGEAGEEEWRPPPGRRVAIAAALAVLALLVWMVWPRPDHVRAGIEAFPDRLGIAESEFLAALDEEPANVTARLYLGRIYRRQARYDEAAEMLRGAAAAAPADADVRRELGYLFLDLDRPTSAAEQFRRAQQIEPEDALNWIGLIRALRAAGDPEAEVVLSRAPAEVRARLAPADSG